MLFLYFLPFLWQFISYISAKRAMEFQKEVEVWLEESMLFPECFGVQQVTHSIENHDYLSTSENVKAESGDFKSEDDIQKLSSIMDGWMDEKLDLSVLDYLEDLSAPQNDPQKAMVEDCSKLLDSLMDGGVNALHFPFFENLQVENKYLESLEEYIGSPATILSNSPAPEGIVPEIILEVVDSPATTISNSPSPEGIVPESFLEVVNSPATLSSECSVDCNTSSPSDSESGFEDGINGCDPNLESMKYQESDVSCVVSLGISPQSFSVLPEYENRKFSAADHNMASPRISSKRKNPYSEVYENKRQQRRERKKVQNKEAAARYRVKKRVQDKILDDEVRNLQSDQKKLEEKANQLKSEISYLKSLMREMFKAKGLLK